MSRKRLSVFVGICVFIPVSGCVDWARVSTSTDATALPDQGLADATGLAESDAPVDAPPADVPTATDRSDGSVQDVPRDLGGSDLPLVDAGPSDVILADTPRVDVGAIDAGAIDTGAIDTGLIDSGLIDTPPTDNGLVDTGRSDTGSSDTGRVDTGPERVITCPLAIGSTTCRGPTACCAAFLIFPSGCGCTPSGGGTCGACP